MQSEPDAHGAWIKSSHSHTGGCVEMRWIKSSRCHEGGCVEVAALGDSIQVRDSKDPEGPVLTFTRTEMAAFVAGAQDGEFDAYT